MAETAKQFMNVAECRPIYDSVLVSGFLTDPNDVEGWFTTFALMGAQNEHHFFNVRNKSVGLAYNNQDKRDSMPYGMRATSFGVAFFAPTIRNLWQSVDAGMLADEDFQTMDIWEKELPRHCSVEFSVMQDEHIAANCFTTPPGYGVTGGGFGRSTPGIDGWTTLSSNTIKGQATQGVPVLTNRWPFPTQLDIPRGANLSATLRFSTYAQQLLQTMIGPSLIAGRNSDGTEYSGIYSCFGIQVSIFGEALVQQRGQYHR